MVTFLALLFSVGMPFCLVLLFFLVLLFTLVLAVCLGLIVLSVLVAVMANPLAFAILSELAVLFCLLFLVDSMTLSAPIEFATLVSFTWRFIFDVICFLTPRHPSSAMWPSEVSATE